MKLSSYKKVYFIGIGGIGMSALARWFRAFDYHVAGYDRTATDLTTALAEEGIDIHFEDEISNIPSAFLSEDVLVIYTPAIPEDSLELNYFKIQGNKLIKRADALGVITDNTFTVAVAGTHGKTTTSTMVAHVLKSCGMNTSAFLGGISQNYNTNLLLGDANKPDPIVVVEADEYDRSFLKLNPNITVVTTMDPDHLDIYANEQDFVNTFFEFVAKTDVDGIVIYREDMPLATVSIPRTKLTFGWGKNDYSAKNLRVEQGQFVFEIIEKDNLQTPHTINLSVPGAHNVLNALASFAVGRALKIDAGEIAKALATFKGVKRRFEYIYKSKSAIYIDDYAHHPTELTAFIGAVKTLYPDKKLTLVFQPHLYSRTRDFMEGFVTSLSLADEVILLDIYPARELPIEGITSLAILSRLDCKQKHLVSKEELISVLERKPLEILATVGAGDVDKFVGMIEKMLIKKHEIEN